MTRIRTNLSGMTEEQKLEHRRAKFREKSRRWRAANTEKHREQVKEWQQANPDKLQAYAAIRTKRQRERLETDPEFAERRRKQWREWAKGNRTPDDVRRIHLKQHYGITLEDYDAMLVAQDGRCAICQTDRPGNKSHKYFAVDHCHTEDKVRSLLCHGCNTGLGAFDDDPARLRAAADYLDAHCKS